jgi:hypothetical protein
VWDNVVPILLGFVLTTVIGGLFASLLQQRSWRNQNMVRLREEDRQKASDVCQKLSGLVDKRWYRMQRLLWAIIAHAEGRLAVDAVNARLRDYDEVLLEWNDQLNARLAVVGAYFGRDVRDFLDKVVYEAFKEAGQHLEGLYREATTVDGAHVNDGAVDTATAMIGRLNNLAYQLSVTMMVRVREEKVGRAAPDVLGEETLGGPLP